MGPFSLGAGATISLPRILLIATRSQGLPNQCFVPLILFASMVVEDSIHLLQRSLLRLRTEEPRPKETEDAEDAEKDVCAVADVLNHGWRHQSNDEVEEPLTGLRECRAFGP